MKNSRRSRNRSEQSWFCTMQILRAGCSLLFHYSISRAQSSSRNGTGRFVLRRTPPTWRRDLKATNYALDFSQQSERERNSPFIQPAWVYKHSWAGTTLLLECRLLKRILSSQCTFNREQLWPCGCHASLAILLEIWDFTASYVRWVMGTIKFQHLGV